VLNRVTSKDTVDEKEIEKALGQKVYWKLPNNYKASIEAINQGKPLIAINNSALVDSYVKLAQQLTGKQAPRGSSSWWRRAPGRS
jgi:pilus assembly protein CpaE